MAQLNLSHTLTAGTPENINDVQDNFQDIVDHVNNALIGDDNLTSPNNSVAKPIFQVQGYVTSAMAANTYVFHQEGSLASFTPGGGGMHNTAMWIPNSAAVAVSGKTTQVRVVAYLSVNAVTPAANFTVGLSNIATITGSGSMSYTLNAAATTAVFTTPALGTATRAESSWITLPAANPYCLTLALSATLNANSIVAITATIEMRHN